METSAVAAFLGPRSCPSTAVDVIDLLAEEASEPAGGRTGCSCL